MTPSPRYSGERAGERGWWNASERFDPDHGELMFNRIGVKGCSRVLAGAIGVAVLLCFSLETVAQPSSKAVFRAAPAAAAKTEQAKPAEPAPLPTTGPAAKRPDTPKGAFDLVEWVIVVVDPNRPNANDVSAFKSTMPGFARG